MSSLKNTVCCSWGFFVCFLKSSKSLQELDLILLPCPLLVMSVVSFCLQGINLAVMLHVYIYIYPKSFRVDDVRNNLAITKIVILSTL